MAISELKSSLNGGSLPTELLFRVTLVITKVTEAYYYG
jgi:hypothetical protein